MHAWESKPLNQMKELLSDATLLMNLKCLEVLVLDEADRMIETEYQDDLSGILQVLPKQRRTAIFSATLSGQKWDAFLKLGMRNPVKISLKKQSQSESNYSVPDSLENYYLLCQDREQKIYQLLDSLAKHQEDKIMIFMNTCSSVDYYSKVLKLMFKQVQVFDIHGQMKQKKRNKVIQQFRDLPKGTISMPGFLICTDVVARGIDIDDVNFIFQVDPP